MRVKQAKSNIKPNNYVRPINLLLWLLCTPVFLLPLCLSGKAFADEVQFYVNVPETLNVSLLDSSGAAIGTTTSINVDPKTASVAFNEKDITVNVSTNNEWGYNLVMSVPSTVLRSSASTIANLPSGSFTCTTATATSCNFTVNSWGYKIKSATNTMSATNYVSVPSSANLNKSTGVVTNHQTKLSFGSRVNTSQSAGAYSTAINFIVTVNPDPRPVMQDATKSSLATLMPNNGNSVIMKDARDGSGYTITNINGTYWMTQNLRIMGTISAALSNFSSGTFNIAGGGSLTLGSSSSVARATYNGNEEYGAYYNYCAASAGTRCTTFASATQDICPAGWRLPSVNEANTVSKTYWNPVMPGCYNGGGCVAGKNGWWWTSASGSDDGFMDTLQYTISDGFDITDWSATVGLSIRCIKN